MAPQPTPLCTLIAGKLLGGQKNFVATFNWLVSCLANIQTDDGKTLEGIESGTPKIPSTMKLKSGKLSNVEISEEKGADGYFTIDVFYA